MSAKVAVSQKPPVLLDRERTIETALASIEEATAQGAVLPVFPEAFVPACPTCTWRLKPGGDMRLSGELHASLHRNAVDLSSSNLRLIQDAEVDAETAMRARRSLDVAGHHARPDVFSFAVDHRAKPPAKFSD